jgi:hypothetical protein
MSNGFDMNPKDWAVVAAVGVGFYLLWQGIQAAKGAASAVGSAVASGAAAVESGTVSVVGAIGSAVGLPTPDETLHDPKQVRWIIDHVGRMAASEWGTALAFTSAIWMNEGAGDNNPPPDWVLGRLGINPGSVVQPKLQNAVIDYVTGGSMGGSVGGSIGSAIGGDFGINNGPSFGQVASGQTSTNPFWWNRA